MVWTILTAFFPVKGFYFHKNNVIMSAEAISDFDRMQPVNTGNQGLFEDALI